MTDRVPVLRIERRPDAAMTPDRWPDSVPAVAHLLERGLDVPAGVTFLVGENGAGKSTIVEAVAEALEIPVDGGTSDHRGGAERPSSGDGSDLGGRLRVVRESALATTAQGRAGFFLRAETMHRFVSYLAEAGAPAAGGPVAHPLHQVSHGESFVEMLTGPWVRRASVVLLDEPESALSFTTSLALADVLGQLAAAGKHVLCATHSPLLTALPGARILQLDDAGITQVAWDELEIVEHWRGFLSAPGRYLRHLVE